MYLHPITVYAMLLLLPVVTTGCIYDYPDRKCLELRQQTDVELTLQAPGPWTRLGSRSSKWPIEARIWLVSGGSVVADTIFDCTRLRESGSLTLSMQVAVADTSELRARVWAAAPGSYTFSGDGAVARVAQGDGTPARFEAWTATGPVSGGRCRLALEHATAALVLMADGTLLGGMPLTATLVYSDIQPAEFDLDRGEATGAAHRPVAPYAVTYESGTDSVMLGYDLLLVNEKAPTVRFTVDIAGADGKPVVSSAITEAPLRRGSVTVVHGVLLTPADHGEIMVSPTFEGDFNYFLE